MKFKKLNEVDVVEEVSEILGVDESGVKRVPAGSIGKVKTINDVEPDENGNVKIDIPEPVEHTWETLPDKPFDVEKGNYFAMEETSVNTSESGITNITSYFQMKFMKEGANFIVEFDGAIYNTTVKTFEYFDSEISITYTHLYIGNGAPLGDLYGESVVDSGEPFTIYLDEFGDCYLKSEPLTTHSMLVYYETDIVKTLDEKFIPDNIARQNIIDFKQEKYATGSWDYNLSKAWEDIEKLGFNNIVLRNESGNMFYCTSVRDNEANYVYVDIDTAYTISINQTHIIVNVSKLISADSENGTFYAPTIPFTKFILMSPNGTYYNVSVTDEGELTVKQ